MKYKLPLRLAVFALAVWPSQAGAQVVVDLGAAANFAAVAGATMTVSIATAHTTTITGDIGATGVISGGSAFDFVTGANHGSDSFTQAAQNDLATAYTSAAGQTPTHIYAAISELGGLTLGPGVYNDPSSFSITIANLTLDAGGDPNAVWIFQAGSTLTTTQNISLINSANAANVFWQVGSSATIGASTSFSGTVIALSDITFGANATLDGRLLAQTGAVTIGGNNVVSIPSAVPEPATYAFLAGGGALGLAFWRRRRAAC